MRKSMIFCAFCAFSLSLFANEQTKDVESPQTQIQSHVEYKNTDSGYSLQLPSILEERGGVQIWDLDLDARIFLGIEQVGELKSIFAVCAFSVGKDYWAMDEIQEALQEALSGIQEAPSDTSEQDIEFDQFSSIGSLAPSEYDASAFRFVGAECDDDESGCIDLHLFEKEDQVIGVMTFVDIEGQTAEQKEAFNPDAFTSLILKTLSFE